MTINCPRCGTKMELFDNDDSDGNFSGWEWKCKCGYSEEALMTNARMQEIINKEIPFNDLVKNSGIYEFYQEGSIAVGVSFEEDEMNNDTYIFNLFLQNEYININGTGRNQETINELVKTWNELLEVESERN